MGTSDSSNAESNTTVAVKEIRSLIFSGDLGAGTDHLESELAARLGMSRTPVREALLRLESQGLVEVRPRKGIRIKPLSPTDMAEIYDILTELESLAAANAAQRNLTETDLAPLATAISDMERALGNNDREAWAVADTHFHQHLVELGNNQRIIQIVRMMSDQVRRARAVTLYMRPPPTSSNRDHKQVLEAIRNGAADEAREIHRQHRLTAKAVLIDLLKRHKLHNI